MEQPIEKEPTYYCECCNYKCMYPAHWKQHLECEKHKNNLNIIVKRVILVIFQKDYLNYIWIQNIVVKCFL